MATIKPTEADAPPRVSYSWESIREADRIRAQLGEMLRARAARIAAAGGDEQVRSEHIRAASRDAIADLLRAVEAQQGGS